MPNYPWLYTDKTDTDALPRKIAVQRQLGVPYAQMTDEEIKASTTKQGELIAADLKTSGAEIPPDREIVAVIAYLQKLGQSEKVAPRPGLDAQKTADATPN